MSGTRQVYHKPSNQLIRVYDYVYTIPDIGKVYNIAGQYAGWVPVSDCIPEDMYKCKLWKVLYD